MRRAYRIGILIPFLSVDGVGKVLWGERPENWKWAYGQVEVEAQRTATCEAEIVESYWKFTVHHHDFSTNVCTVYERSFELQLSYLRS